MSTRPAGAGSRFCPDCDRSVIGGPDVFVCARGHVLASDRLDPLEETEQRVARAAAARAHELELERATHVAEHRSGVMPR